MVRLLKTEFATFAIRNISETIEGIIKCDISNYWAYFSLFVDIDNILIIPDSRKL